MKAKPIKFETLDQILDDKICIQIIQKKIEEIRNRRERLLNTLKAGQKFKRGAIDTLQELQMFNPKSFIAQFKLIKNKVSKLSAREREFITLMVSQAISGTIHHYENMEKVQLVRAEAKKKREAKIVKEGVEQ